MPTRLSVSATCRKTRRPPTSGMYSSRSCWPEPVIVTTAGSGPRAFNGFVRVPPSVMPPGPLNETSSAVYGASRGAE